MKSELTAYLSDALARIEAGYVQSPSGSWIAGIFGKAAKLFENEMRAYVRNLLIECGLSYPDDMPTTVKGCPKYYKLTLGQLLNVIREARYQRPELVELQMPPGWKLFGFTDEVDKINKSWVAIKHGEDVPPENFIIGMKMMLALSELLRRG